MRSRERPYGGVASDFIKKSEIWSIEKWLTELAAAEEAIV